MALNKKVTYDYEVRGEYKKIQVRERTAIVENGKELSYSYSRRLLHSDDDVSGESDELKALTGSLWTDEVKAAYVAHLNN